MALVMAAELEQFELRPSEATILCMIDRNPGISQASISKMIATRRPNVSPIARDLQRRGLIERRRAGGKGSGLAVTAEGKILSEKINAIVGKNEERMLDTLPPVARDLFKDALEDCGRGFLDRLRELKPDASPALE